MADGDEHVRGRSVAENELESLCRRPACERGVVRGPAAREEDTRGLGKPSIADPVRDLPKPLGLRGDGLSSQLSGHERCLYHRRSGCVREDGARQWRPRRYRTDAAGGIGFLLHHARGRFSLRDPRIQGDRALRRAHVLQGHGAPPDGAHDLDGDRRDRRRIQRFHRQGSHRLLREVRHRNPGHRTRRPHRHAPQLPLRLDRDTQGEGRDPRGDERLSRHPSALRRKHLRPTPVRRPAARLGHSRDEGDDRVDNARDVHVLPRRLVPARADRRRGGRTDRGRSVRASRRAAGWHRAEAHRDTNAGRAPRTLRR